MVDMFRCPIGTMSYTLEEGDTIEKIAEMFSTTEDIILQYNPNITYDMMIRGLTICVPYAINACEGEIYTIKSGDTLYKISRAYNVSVRDIMNANLNVDVYNLQVGETICIPRMMKPCRKGDITIILQENDTLTTILTKYDISYYTLKQANPSVNLLRFRVGQKLCIPQKKGYINKKYNRVYIIEEETLEDISQKFNISTDMLLITNQRLSPSDFITGVEIAIPNTFM